VNINKHPDLISIVIPYYKKKKYISESIQSVLNQSYQNFEIILVYDDKNITELDFIKDITKIDNRINLIVNKSNLGAAISRNKGIQYAKGDFIAFLDADDLWKKNKLEKQINFMKKNKFDFCHTTYEIIDDNYQIIKQRKARNFYEVDDLIKSCDIGLSTVILSKKIINLDIRFPELKTKEDFVFWLKILQLKIPIVSIDETLSSWRKIDNSLSSSTFQKLLDAFKVYNYYMKFNFLKSCYLVACLSINYLRK